jgi:C-terminal processing protease CtpA/Prc
MRSQTDCTKGLGLLLVVIALLSCGQSMGTIGAVLARNDVSGRVRVMKVPAQEGAARAGLIPDDELLSIDGRDVRAMTKEQMHEALVGPSGSTVSLTVVRDGKVLHLVVQRGKFKL